MGIFDALSLYFQKDETEENIKKNILTSKAFSLLLASYKETAKSKAPKHVSNEDWIKIRQNYETACKNENENAFGLITFNENYISSTSVTNDDLDKKIFNLEISIELLLKNIHSSNWVFKIKENENENEKFQYQMAIVNLAVETDIFELVIIALKKKYPYSLFSLRPFQDKVYIEGLFK